MPVRNCPYQPDATCFGFVAPSQPIVRWTQPADWQSNYDTASRRIAPGTIAFQSHDLYSVTAYANIRVKLLP